MSDPTPTPQTRSARATASQKGRRKVWTENKPKPAPPRGFRKRATPFKEEVRQGAEAYDRMIANRPKLVRPPRSTMIIPDPHNVQDRQHECTRSATRGTHDTRRLHPHDLFDHHPADLWRD